MRSRTNPIAEIKTKKPMKLNNTAQTKSSMTASIESGTYRHDSIILFYEIGVKVLAYGNPTLSPSPLFAVMGPVPPIPLNPYKSHHVFPLI